MLLETKRLLLREMNPEDFDALLTVLGDPETMWHYPYTFNGQHVRDWIERNMNRYRKDGFGLWAVCLKDSREMIGDCGLTLQNINGETLPEIGYHIRRDCQRKGYANEAARAVRDWAFRNTDYLALYSYCKYTNEPSFRTAESIGMRFACEYPDEINGKTHVSVMTREEWLNVLTENMIRWAENKLGSREYASWCLSFIEDALEKSNGIEIFGGDSAKASALLYADGMRQGMPERGAFVFYDCICQGPDGPVNWGHCGISLGDGKIIHAWDTVRIDDCREIEAMTALSGDHAKYIGWVPVDRVLKQRAEPETFGSREGYAYISLRERPQLLERAASWFHEKWGVPENAYVACMSAYLNRQTEYGWYLCLAKDRIVGGLGVIENDFHDRKDLAPNVCAVYTEESERGRGIAGRLLALVVEDMRAKGMMPLYLVTDHTGFYERYGWEFLCMAHEEDGGDETRVYIHH